MFVIASCVPILNCVEDITIETVTPWPSEVGNDVLASASNDYVCRTWAKDRNFLGENLRGMEFTFACNVDYVC